MVAVRSRQSERPSEQIGRRVGLVVRVSTDRQAASDEGSLRNQMQRLRQHVDYKRSACGEDWAEVAVYELRAVSGKYSLRSPELQRLLDDIRSGRINTVLCTALDRISRSVKDFLSFFEVLTDHDAEFVCLKQNYDTTTPQGRLFVTIMMALAEFEREQTADRTREAVAARAERGLWNGGQLLGYDLDPQRKGYLIPNEREVAVINAAFDIYLECGSIAATATELNRRGYRTKSFSSRRGREHAAHEFATTGVQYLLKNPAYIGMKAINKGKMDEPGGPRSVPAVWPAIIDREKFDAVQDLLAVNGQSRHNAAKEHKHVYVLNGGLLWCGLCGSLMEGRSGTGRGGSRHYYYACRNRDCPLRIVAHEIEEVVLERLRQLSMDETLLDRLTKATNRRLQRQVPTLKKQRTALQRDLADVQGQADRLLEDWSGLGETGGQTFVTARLDELARRRAQLQESLDRVDEGIRQAEQAVLVPEVVREVLGNAGRLYEVLKPYERKELFRLLIRRAEVRERTIVLEIAAPASEELPEAPGTPNGGAPRFGRTEWLPDEDSNLEPSG